MLTASLGVNAAHLSAIAVVCRAVTSTDGDPPETDQTRWQMPAPGFHIRTGRRYHHPLIYRYKGSANGGPKARRRLIRFGRAADGLVELSDEALLLAG